MQVSTDELYHLVMAAHYLNVPRLLDLCTDAMAERIRGKSPAQVRECFGLKPSLSPEEVCRVAPFSCVALLGIGESQCGALVLLASASVRAASLQRQLCP